MTEPVREEAASGERFAYFTIRVRLDKPGDASFTGVVERLGTGRKRPFPDAGELLRLLFDWSRVPSKMRITESGSNEPHDVRYRSSTTREEP